MEWAELRDELMQDPANQEAWERRRPQYELASKMVALRAATGLTQQQLAERTGMKQSAIARLESGTVEPSDEVVASILSAAAQRDHEAQRRSFAYGNVALSNPNVTREMIDKAADENQ